MCKAYNKFDIVKTLSSVLFETRTVTFIFTKILLLILFTSKVFTFMLTMIICHIICHKMGQKAPPTLATIKKWQLHWGKVAALNSVKNEKPKITSTDIEQKFGCKKTNNNKTIKVVHITTVTRLPLTIAFSVAMSATNIFTHIFLIFHVPMNRYFRMSQLLQQKRQTVTSHVDRTCEDYAVV